MNEGRKVSDVRQCATFMFRWLVDHQITNLVYESQGQMVSFNNIELNKKIFGYL